MLKIRIILLLCLSFSVQAKLATVADYPSKILSRNLEIYVYKDGSTKQKYTIRAQVCNETGRERLGNVSINYNSTANKFKLLSAKTINDQQEIKVPDDHIEDKPIPSNQLSFDQINAVRINFPQLKLNSIIEYSYEINAQKYIPNHYSDKFFFGASEYVENYNISITSEMPLFIQTNKAEQELDITKTTKGNLYYLTIKQQRPQAYSLINESYSQLLYNDYPWVLVSTNQTWEQYGAWFVTEYEKIAQQALPPLYLKIKTAAAQQATLKDKIATISQMLQDNIRYTMDMRYNQGLFIPRDLAKVAKYELADCKDYAMAVTVILRSLGIKADIAFVASNMCLDSVVTGLASATFNHAITKIEDDGEVLWFDPTSYYCLLGINDPAFANNPCLVLYPQEAKLEFIKSNTPDQAISINEQVYKFNPERTKENLELNMQFKGLAAIPFTGAHLYSNKESFNNSLLEGIISLDNIITSEIKVPELNQRVVQDITISGKVTAIADLLSTSFGDALVESEGYLAKIYLIRPDSYGNRLTGKPETLITITKIKGAKKPTRNLNAKVDNKWFSFERQVRQHGDTLEIKTTFINKVWVIYNKELHSPEYAQAMQQLEQKFIKGLAIILS